MACFPCLAAVGGAGALVALQKPRNILLIILAILAVWWLMRQGRGCSMCRT